MRDLLNKANQIMNTANNTAYNANRTKNTMSRMTDSAKRSKEQKVAEKALEWKCECGKKTSSKFCDSCGKAKPACPNCGAAPTGGKFCGDCGSAMEE